MRKLLFAFFLYSLVFHWYPYCYQWETPDQPTGPLYIILSRDVSFLVLATLGLAVLALRGRIVGVRQHLLTTVALPYILLFILFLLAFAKLPLTDGLQHNFRNLLMYAMTIVLYLTAAKHREHALPSLFARTFLYAGMVLSLFGISTFFLLDKSLLWGGIRVYSLLGNPNTFGTFLVIPLSIAYVLALRSGSVILKASLALAMAINIVALILALSFQAMLCAAVATVAIAIIVKEWKSIPYLLSTTGAIVGVAWIAVTTYPTLARTFWFRIQDPTASSYRGRIAQLEFFVDEMSRPENWMLGVLDSDGYIALDSQYYNIVLNNGAIALLLYVFPVLYVIVKALRFRAAISRTSTDWEYAMYVSALIFLIIALTVSFNFTAMGQRFPLNFYFYLFLALLLKKVSDVSQGAEDTSMAPCGTISVACRS